MTENQLKAIRIIRGLLPKRLYLGGSQAQKRFFFNNPVIEAKDIDLFYFGDRPMERWMFINAISTYFNILQAGFRYDGGYKIPGQYWFFKLSLKEDPSVLLDFICIHDSYKAPDLWAGSTLGKIAFEVVYSDSLFGKLLPSTGLVDALLQSRICYIYEDDNTEEQIKKIVARAEALGLEVIKR